MCFFDSRHWVVDKDIIPFAITTKISANCQQYLKVMEEPAILKKVRTEEEKQRRHIDGDAGAKFSAREYEKSTKGISNAITTFTKDNLLMEKYRIRKLTPREVFRLMGVRDKDIDTIQATGLSESQQYKMAGNSIVVDTLVHGIFTPLFIEEPIKDTLF